HDGLPRVGAVSQNNFRTSLWEQIVHFHVTRLMDSLFLWVKATRKLSNLAMAMCCRCGSDPRLLWLCRRPAAAVTTGPLAWEPPYATDVTLKIQNE
uniref:Uncharacterized protein n=1 Tax=Sus scrofa TaxID=9823 RepID=A0A287ABQ6_PIG